MSFAKQFVIGILNMNAVALAVVMVDVLSEVPMPWYTVAGGIGMIVVDVLAMVAVYSKWKE